MNNWKQLPHDGRRFNVQSFRLNLGLLYHSALLSTLRDLTLSDVARRALCQRRCGYFEGELSHTGKERLAVKIQTGQDGRLESDKEKDYQQFSWQHFVNQRIQFGMNADSARLRVKVFLDWDRLSSFYTSKMSHLFLTFFVVIQWVCR